MPAEASEASIEDRVRKLEDEAKRYATPATALVNGRKAAEAICRYIVCGLSR